MSIMASVKRLRSILFPWRQIRLVEQVGGEVARECRADLWRRIQARINDMSVPEARGYARAHAVGCAASLLDQVIDRHSLKSAIRARVLSSSVDQLVGMILRDNLCEETPAGAVIRAA